MDVLLSLRPFIELGAVALLALGLLAIVAATVNRVLRQSAAREIAMRQEWARSNREIATILNNHLQSVAENQAKTAVALDLIVNRMLDRVLPKEP